MYGIDGNCDAYHWLHLMGQSGVASLTDADRLRLHREGILVDGNINQKALREYLSAAEAPTKKHEEITADDIGIIQPRAVPRGADFGVDSCHPLRQ